MRIAQAQIDPPVPSHLHGEYVKAKALYRHGIESFEGLFGEDHIEMLVAKGSLASTVFPQERQDEVKSIHESTLARLKKLLKYDGSNMLQAMQNLARCHCVNKNNEKRRAGFNEVFKLQEKVLSREHPLTILTEQNLV